MFLSYYQQFELANQHRRDLEARAAKERLYRLLEKPTTRSWGFANLFKPRAMKAGKEKLEGEQMVPVLGKVYATKF